MSVQLPVANLRINFDPLAAPPWGCAAITKQEVLLAAKGGGLSTQHPKTIARADWSRKQHISRIAYLVLHGWTAPIDIDVGVPSLGCYVAWPILDGNHRLAAAIVRGDLTIEASVSGAMDLAQQLFGVDCCEAVTA